MEPIVCVLAGGRARRLGGAKATISLAGRPLIDYPLASARRAGFEAVVVAKPDSPLPDVDVPVWLEQEETAHPAAGIAEALRRASGRPAIVVACDMPLLAPGLLLDLARREGRAVVPRTGERLHPLCARYEAPVRESLEQSIAAGTALQAAVEELEPVLIGEEELAAFGEPDVVLFNVNTREDLARAGELLRTPG